MMSPRHLLLLAAAFGCGLGVGIYVQHRWPLGRVRDELTTRPSRSERTLEDIARLPRTNRLVVVCAGQSNAANYGATRRSAGANVYAFFEGKLFLAVDPLPGGDGYGGSIWTRLAARLALHTRADAIVLAVVAQGSTAVSDWEPGGRNHDRLRGTLDQLATVGLPVDFVLWQQGETEGWSAASSGRDYSQSLGAIQAITRAAAPDAIFLAAAATYAAGVPSNEQIRLAQSVAAQRPASSPGPDLDQLDTTFRFDGIHFNDRGLGAAADLWLEKILPQLARQPNPPRTR